MDERRIGDLLVDAGIISRPDLEEVLARAREGGSHRVLSELYALGLAHERPLAEVLAHRLGMPVAVLSECVIDLNVVRMVPRELLRAHRVLPVTADERSLTVVAADPEAPGLTMPLSFATGRRVVPLLGIQIVLEGALDDVLAAADAGGGRWAGANATTFEPHVSIARHAPALALAEANEIARKIVEALSDEPYAAGRPIGAVRLKQMVIEKPPPPASAPVVVEERVRTRSDPALRQFELASIPEPSADAEPLALVVDDDEGIRTLLTRALEHDGLTVVQAKDGDEAVTLLRLMRPHVVLLDAMLPKVHGFEICAAIKRSELKSLPVIMISAVYRGVEQAREILEVHGADHFVEKPFEITYVRKLVAEVLRRPHAPQPPPADLAARIEETRKAYEDHAAHGLFLAAEADVQLWISLDPFDGKAWLERGNLCAVNGDLVGAMSSFEAAVVYDPSLLLGHLGLAVVYEQLGFQRRAHATWLKARELAPDDATRTSIDRHLAHD